MNIEKTKEKIAGIEKRMEAIKFQMTRLLQVAANEEQKQAVNLGHQMALEEMQNRIEALRSGESDPWESEERGE
jgi:hypothetical protein